MLLIANYNNDTVIFSMISSHRRHDISDKVWALLEPNLPGRKLQHLVENAFLHLKRWWGIASRYAKNAKSFLAAVQIRCIALWVNIL